MSKLKLKILDKLYDVEIYKDLPTDLLTSWKGVCTSIDGKKIYLWIDTDLYENTSVSINQYLSEAVEILRNKALNILCE